MNTSTNTQHRTPFVTAAAAVVAAAAVIAIGTVATSEEASAGPAACSVSHEWPPAVPAPPFSETFTAHTGGKAVVGP